MKRSWTKKELYLYVFRHIRHIFAEWVGWKNRNTKKEHKSGRRRVSKLDNLIELPFKRNMTKAKFNELSDEDAYRICNPNMFNDKIEPKELADVNN